MIIWSGATGTQRNRQIGRTPAEVSGELAGTLDGRAIHALEAFGVPFVMHERGGRCVGTSAAALTLLGGHPQGDLVWNRAACLAADALAAARGRAGHLASAAVSTVAGCAMTVRLVRQDDGLVAVVVLRPARPVAADSGDRLAEAGLTGREGEVALLVAAGRSTKEVAGALGISCHTARRHTERVFAKLGVHGRVALALLLATPAGEATTARPATVGGA